MCPLRILDDKQERDVAIAYLCSVSPEHLRKRWRVAQSTIIATILNQRSPYWNDPLLEYYKSRQRNVLNLAHFCLAYEAPEGMGVDRMSLVDANRDQDIYQAISEDVIGTAMKSIADTTGLACFVEPYTGIEKLLNDVFGKRTVEKVLHPIFTARLYAKYQTGREFTLNRLTEEIRTDVAYKLKYGGLTITPLKERLFYEALRTLPQREALILELRYGIKGNSILRLEQIGRGFDLTRERVRQIEDKALQRLRQGKASHLLRALYGLSLDLEAAQALSIGADAGFRGQ